MIYRHADDPGHAGRFYDRLVAGFGEENVFMDVALQPGDDVKSVIKDKLAGCDIVAVILGPRWLDLLRQQPHDDFDFVLFEITLAFQYNKRVVPVLVGGCKQLPAPRQLPPAISELAKLQYDELRPRTFDRDSDFLVQKLQNWLKARKN